ncbi:hypothetical protein AB0E81_11285 [Streptomyces sp. NPDC033538]|uniref:hypothetical protein n=1 Tax=Streptomyces sp. NPDC033538 TaxID=3155367 RepID=UPI00340703A2
MRYIDNTGDTWEDAEEETLRVVSAQMPGDVGLVFTRSSAEELYGPLRPLADGTSVEPQDAPLPALPSITDVMDRADVFRAAHALVADLKWDEREYPAVFDVLSVAKWLEGDE